MPKEIFATPALQREGIIFPLFDYTNGYVAFRTAFSVPAQFFGVQSGATQRFPGTQRGSVVRGQEALMGRSRQVVPSPVFPTWAAAR